MNRTFITLAACLLAAPAFAQGPAGAATLTPGEVADSQSVLADLDKRVRANPKDAAAWYRRGMVAWALADRARAPGAPRGLDPTTLGRLADTSLRIAAQVAPANSYYKLAVGRFLLASGMAMTRSAAENFFEGALGTARKGADSSAWAEAAVEFGRTFWRRYDALANRRLEIVPGTAVRSISSAMQPMSRSPDADMDSPMYDMKMVREALERNTQALPPDVTGEKEYEKASELFAEAYAVAPAHPRALRSMAMLLAEKDKWAELLILGQRHTRLIPWDAWGWMVLGLATHRTGDSRNAAMAYDSAMTYLSATERARLDRITRVLPRSSDSLRMVRGGDAERTALMRLYWTLADPLWSRAGNESRIEYFARVTFAELRWTVDELFVKGADSDRGNIFVRYGPPDITAVLGPDLGNSLADIATIWVYSSGLMFMFTGQQGFATARTSPEDLKMVAELTQAQPVRWDNLATIRVDTMPTQVARFRAGDSVDVFVAAQPPLDTIRRYSDVGSVRTDFWLLFPNTAIAKRDSAVISPNGAQGWGRRVGPGSYLYRVEASTEGSVRAGRATATIDAGGASFPLSGFGVSDLLIATSAEPRGATALRWTDFDIAPTAGAIPHAGQLALVWENYDFGQREGSAHYTVSVTLTRLRSLTGNLAAQIPNIADVARTPRGDDRMTLTFERTMPHSAAFADNVLVTLGDTPAGSYTLTLEVTDRDSGKSAIRVKSFIIRR